MMMMRAHGAPRRKSTGTRGALKAALPRTKCTKQGEKHKGMHVAYAVYAVWWLRNAQRPYKQNRTDSNITGLYCYI